MEGSGDNEDEIIKELPINAESSKYFTVTANNIIKTYNKAGKETVTVKKYPLEKCQLS